MRYLIVAICTLALLGGTTPAAAAGPIVDCGRVTTFVPPNSPGALNGGDGWVIVARSDGTSEKAIIRAGMQLGELSGYVCLAIDGIYVSSVVTPEMPRYIPEASTFVPQGTAVYCGIVIPNSITSGQGSGLRTYEFQVTSGPGGGGRFGVSNALPLPIVGTYICGRFAQGVPMNGLLGYLSPGDPGYVVNTLPSTSTSPTGELGAAALTSVLVAMLLLAGLGALIRGRSPTLLTRQ